jgi:hypothetical protein
LAVFGLGRISATCLYSYWCRTSAFAECITDKLNKSWLMLDFGVMRLMSPDHLDFPRMDTDEPRMDTDRSNFGYIRDIRSAQCVSYPCPSVENLTSRHVDNAVDRCPLAASRDHPEVQYEPKSFRNYIKILIKYYMMSITLSGALTILPLPARAVPISFESSLELAVQADILMSSLDESSIRTRQTVKTWQSSRRSNLIYSNLGWDTVNVTAGIASLSSDLLYSFVPDVDGFFQLDYNIAAFGSDLSGLNGFRFSWLSESETTALFFPFQPELKKFSIIGNLVRPVTVGQIYTMRIENEANIAGALGTRNTSMNAIFSWAIIPVPEPPMVSILVIALAALGLGFRHRSQRRRRT